MSLHINLFHEEQSKIVERKRDPLKLGVLALLMVSMGFYGYYLTQVVKKNHIARDREEIESKWNKLAPLSDQGKTDEATAKSVQDSTTALEGIIRGRFYWGPLLTEIIAGTGPEIQITGFDGSIRDGDNIILTVSGLSAGKEPRAVAERFRQSMTERLQKKYQLVSSQFNSLENSEAPLVLQGKSFSTATFAIGFQFQPEIAK